MSLGPGAKAVYLCRIRIDRSMSSFENRPRTWRSCARWGSTSFRSTSTRASFWSGAPTTTTRGWSSPTKSWNTIPPPAIPSSTIRCVPFFRTKSIFIGPTPASFLFTYFRSFQQQFYRKYLDFSWTWTRIVGIEGKHAGHLTATMAPKIIFVVSNYAQV